MSSQRIFSYPSKPVRRQLSVLVTTITLTGYGKASVAVLQSEPVFEFYFDQATIASCFQQG
jgi:hypothetical protein